MLIKEEEQQRVLGLIPDWFVTYQSNAAPIAANRQVCVCEEIG